MKIALALALSLTACMDMDGGGAVEIRACNDTGFDIGALQYSEFTEGNVAAGECTTYRPARGTLYNYTNVYFRIGSDEFRIQPIDFVGEDPLPGGAWSYSITIFDYASRSANVAAVGN